MNGLYESRNDPSGFKSNIRDFLVQSKEFSAQVIKFFSLLQSQSVGLRSRNQYPKPFVEHNKLSG